MENEKKEIINLNKKLNQIIFNLEKEKTEKEKILKLYQKNKSIESNTKNETDIFKSKSISRDLKLNNISPLTHKIIFKKILPKNKLNWYLITVKEENEVKNYLNTFWITEEEMQEINNRMSSDKINFDYDSNEIKQNNIEINNEIINKLKNINEEKEKISLDM